MDNLRTSVVPFLNPLHAILLAFPVGLFPSALLADITYLNTAVIQWTNFASWLIAGAVLFSGMLLAWALLDMFFGRARRRRSRGLFYTVLVAIMFVAGFVNALQHSGDGWHSVQTLGLVLSIVCSVLALIAAFVAYSGQIIRERVG